MSIPLSRIVFFGQVIAGATSLVSITVIANSIGAAAFSYCSTFLMIMIFMMSVIDFGSCAWASRELAANRISQEDYFNVMELKWKHHITLLFLLPVTFFVVREGLEFSLLLFLYPALWNRYNFIQQHLIAKNYIKISTALLVLERICWLLAVPLVQLNVRPDLSFCIPILCGLLLHNVLGLKIIRPAKKIRLRKRITNLELVNKSKYLGVTSLSGSVSNLDGVVLVACSSLTDSSSYILAQRFRNPLTLVFTAVSTRLKPVAATQDHKFLRATLREEMWFIFLGIVGAVILATFLLFYSSLIIDDSFEKVAITLFIGTLVSIPLGFVLLTSGLLNLLGEEKYVSKANLLYSLIMLLGIGISGYNFGGEGAALTLLFILLVYASLNLNKLWSLLK